MSLFSLDAIKVFRHKLKISVKAPLDYMSIVATVVLAREPSSAAQ